MCPIPYYTMTKQSKDPKYIRLEMVRYARENGVKPAARAFDTTVKTVRKWLSRFVPGSLKELEEKSRAPKNRCRKISSEERERAIKLKKELPSFGSVRIKRDYDFSISEKAIRGIWRSEGLLKKKRRKHKTKNDLRAVKALWKLFEQTCVDTKDLIDIPELWPQIRALDLPKVQYTAREVVSGLHFTAYAQERSLAYSKLFAQILIGHLQSCGADLEGCRIQTDNGCEFIGSWNAKEDSKFTKMVESVPGLMHNRIPPAAHTWQADVETAHSLIEDEFYMVENFTSRKDFLEKATTYNLWFNIARKNSYKGHKTPWDIIQERNNDIRPAIVALPPVFLDELLLKKLDQKSKGGYDVIPYPLNRS